MFSKLFYLLLFIYYTAIVKSFTIEEVINNRLCIDTQMGITFSSLEETNENHVVCALFSRSEGWHLFEVESFPGFDNKLKSFAAGFIEGYIYKEYID